jgi:hypothetical protein
MGNEIPIVRNLIPLVGKTIPCQGMGIILPQGLEMTNPASGTWSLQLPFLSQDIVVPLKIYTT